MKPDVPRGKYVVAVSGGVDSVALIDMLSKQPGLNLIVAHFDHGIRSDSADDAALVGALATQYGLPYETRREELGEKVSEQRARERRYAFLRDVAQRHQAGLITAHHGDDVVETIAINLQRGTGWRGLAVLDSDIVRPLLGYTKQELLEYALEHHLVWHEDSTNASDTYLRNRLRRRIAASIDDDARWQLRALRVTQVSLKRAIKQEVEEILGGGPEYSRYLFTGVGDSAADELLRAVCHRAIGVSPTRPQRTRALLMIKTAHPGTVHQVATGTQLAIGKRDFTVQKMI